MKNVLLAIFIILIQLPQTFSQQNLIDFWKSEKIKLTRQQIEQIREGKLNPQNLKIDETSDELLGDEDNIEITKTSNPESEITAAINPTNENNMVVSAIRYTETGFDCPIYYTSDLGSTWKISSFKIGPSQSGIELGGGDPVLCYGPDGTLYYSWIMIYIKSSYDSLVAEMRWAYSQDGGKSWNYGDDSYIGISSVVYNGSSSSLPFILDKQWMVCDNSNSANRGNLYVSVTNLVTYPGQAGYFSQPGIYVGVKKAGEKKFNRKLVMISPTQYPVVQFSSIDCDSKGRVYVSFWAYTEHGHSLWCVYSDDAFKTVSKPVRITNFKFNSNSRLYPDNSYRLVPGLASTRAYPYPQIKVDKSGGKYNGNVYITWCGVGINSILNNGLDIYFSRSTDRGKSWSEPSTLNFDKLDSYSHQFYPTLDVNNNGVVAVTFYDNLNTSGFNNTDYASSISFNGGDKFINRTVVSSAQTNFLTVGLSNNSFGIGEYNGLVMTNDYIIPFWCDGRNNDGGLKIYTTRYPINQVPVIKGYENEISAINGDISDLNVYIDNGNLNVKFKSASSIVSSFAIYDLTGKFVSKDKFETNVGANDWSFSLPGISTGTYFIKFDFNGENYVKKFVVNGM